VIRLIEDIPVEILTMKPYFYSMLLLIAVHESVAN